MSDLLWPGDRRAGTLFSDEAFVAAMVAVESAWVDTELAVPSGPLDAEAGGNAVIPLVAALRDAAGAVRSHLAGALSALDRLAASHGATPMVGRTLTQWALPITFGHKLSAWRAGLSGASDDLAALVFPAQCGGPVGTMRDDRLSSRLGLDDVPSWHTDRRPITRIADALTATTDACGRIARDVLELSRP
jgi:3-carboxy-cis,cis-muconate cycloisomerase